MLYDQTPIVVEQGINHAVDCRTATNTSVVCATFIYTLSTFNQTPLTELFIYTIVLVDDSYSNLIVASLHITQWLSVAIPLYRYARPTLTRLRAWSICIGRISQLPRAAISLDKPTIVLQLEAQPWRPFIDADILGSPMEQPSQTHALLIHFSLLSEIVNDTVFMFYAPRERFTSKKLLDFYSRYKRWYAALPLSLGLNLNDPPLPQVLLLQ